LEGKSKWTSNLAQAITRIP